MREWQVGDPVGDGNDIGVPDIPYMDYLKKHDEKGTGRKSTDAQRSLMFQDEAWILRKEGKFRDALAFMDAAIRYNPNDCENWNKKGIILWNILVSDDRDVGFEACECFDRALEIEPDNKTITNNKAKFLTEWALKLVEWNQFGLADVKVSEALSVFEDRTCRGYGIALGLKGVTLQREGEYDDALEYYNRALEILPGDEDIQKCKDNLLDNFAIASRDNW